MQNIQFTPNFDLKQFIIHNEQYFNSLTEADQNHLIRTFRILSDKLQAFRALVSRPVYITSAFRSPEHNEFVGGRQNSYHLYLNREQQGAADIFYYSINPTKDFEKLKKFFNCVIWYPKKHIFHVDNRRGSTFYDFNGI